MGTGRGADILVSIFAGRKRGRHEVQLEHVGLGVARRSAFTEDLNA